MPYSLGSLVALVSRQYARDMLSAMDALVTHACRQAALAGALIGQGVPPAVADAIVRQERLPAPAWRTATMRGLEGMQQWLTGATGVPGISGFPGAKSFGRPPGLGTLLLESAPRAAGQGMGWRCGLSGLYGTYEL
ncbi:MAG TPA: hypothetical protein VGK74_04430 [Symbiobacteriaceae bacterium]